MIRFCAIVPGGPKCAAAPPPPPKDAGADALPRDVPEHTANAMPGCQCRLAPASPPVFALAVAALALLLHRRRS